MMHDEKFWSDPERFKPERFFNWDPRELQFSPYAIGPRICAGIKISKVIMFYILNMLLQRYELRPAVQNYDIPHYKEDILLMPSEFSITLKRRCT